MSCKLKLIDLLFDNIDFKRIGRKSDEELQLQFSVNFGTYQEDESVKKVTVQISGIKEKEYSFRVQASGFFSFEGDVGDDIIQQNAVAIVMPYVRSQITLLTAQPGVEPIVLPPFNIVEMLKKNGS